MSTSSTRQNVFHLDHEHKGLRIVVMALLFLGLILSFFLSGYVWRMLLPEVNTTAILSCLSAIPLGLLIAGLGEWLLKRTWHSGRTLVAGERRLTLIMPQTAEQALELDKAYQSVWWEIPLAGYPRGGRERRIPSNWYCLAGQLQQGESRIVVYCYANPKFRERWNARYEFVTLEPQDVYNTSLRARMTAPGRPDIPPDVIAGRQGRHWLAERNRWREGVEMTQDDFDQLLQLIRVNPS